MPDAALADFVTAARRFRNRRDSASEWQLFEAVSVAEVAMEARDGPPLGGDEARALRDVYVAAKRLHLHRRFDCREELFDALDRLDALPTPASTVPMRR